MLDLAESRQLEEVTASGLRVVHQNFTFPSFKDTYIKEITDPMNLFIERADPREDRAGLFRVDTGHTTLGFIATEDEDKLLDDFVNFSFDLVWEDERSTRASDSRRLTTGKLTHNCEDNKRLPKGVIDRDHNGAEHIRTVLFARHAIDFRYDKRGIAHGIFQRLLLFETDGRDGTTGLGEKPNPPRVRTITASVYPTRPGVWLEDAILEL